MDLLRAGDRERYLTVLFAPEDKRPALAALYAFDLETARVRDMVSEPMPGEIRLQWWREIVSGERDGEARQNPVARELVSAIDAYALPRMALANLLDARVFDLYDDPIPDRTTLEGYLMPALLSASLGCCATRQFTGTTGRSISRGRCSMRREPIAKPGCAAKTARLARGSSRFSSRSAANISERPRQRSQIYRRA
jgi:hypothetical protein